MKKILFVFLALLFAYGVANAAGIPTGVDPENGPEVWTIQAYNDYGSALTSGSVVTWDYSDTDMSDLDNRKMYITASSTADDITTAGVIVDPSCANGAVCSVAIYGPVATLLNDNTGSLITAAHLVGNDAATKAGNYSGAKCNSASLGWAIDVNTAADSAMGGSNIGVVFVNPTPQADD